MKINLAIVIGFLLYVCIGNCLQNELPLPKQLIINQLKKQFDYYRSCGFDHEQLDTLAQFNNQDFWIAHFQIVDNKLYARFLGNDTALSRFKALAKGLNRMLKNYEVNNTEFIVCLSDKRLVNSIYPQCEQLLKKVPCFVFSKDLHDPHEQHLPLLPDPYLLENWPCLIDQIQEGITRYPWETKINKVFWRGSSSGGTPYEILSVATDKDHLDNTIENFVCLKDAYNSDILLRSSKIPRLTIVMLSKIFPQSIDANFSSYIFFPDTESGRSLKEFLFAVLGPEQWADPVDHLRYKYLISIDGTTAAWLRPVWILFSNSVLLLQETSKTQLFYPAIKPYVHYIPVAQDLSDLVDKIDWLHDHDKQAQEIMKNAQLFVQQALMPQDLEEYLAVAINEYSKLQKFKVISPTLPLCIE